MSTLLICNATVVNEGRCKEVDVFIQNGRIEQIGSDLSHLKAEQFVDGAGKYMMPGMIDTEFMLGSTDSTFQESLSQESKAAIAGGITSCFLVPDLKQLSLDSSVSQFLIDTSQLQTNLAIYAVATQHTLQDIADIDPLSCGGLYVDMASIEDSLRLDESEALEHIFNNSPVPIVLHAEDAPSILENEESYRQIYGDDIPFDMHALIRSDEACRVAAEEALKIALKSQTRVHFLHLSSVKEIELLARARKKSPTLSVGVCSHYLTFSNSDMKGRSSMLKCRPAIKTDIDRAALIQGLLDGDIDMISSGHIPVGLNEKQGVYFDVPDGLALAQYALPAILEHYQDQIVSLELIAEKTSHAVAERFSIKERGFIREGYWADLVLVDLEGSFIARDEDVVSSAASTIFNGNEFRSSVAMTIVNGEIVWSDGHFNDVKPAGQQLEFITERVD